jgi:hypothetical protein
MENSKGNISFENEEDAKAAEILGLIVESMTAELEKSYPEHQMMTDLLVFGEARVKIICDEYSGEVKFDRAMDEREGQENHGRN